MKHPYLSKAPQHSRQIYAWPLLSFSWLIALFASLSVLFIGEILGQMPCTLCWYQRICMFPLVIILGIGSYYSDTRSALYAIVLAVIGLLFAAYHSLLYAQVIVQITPCVSSIPCSGSAMTLFGSLSLPYLSLFSFSLIVTALTLFLRKNRQ